MPPGDFVPPTTKIDGGPQLNSSAYIYDGQPVAKPIVAAQTLAANTPDAGVKTGPGAQPVQTEVATVSPAPKQVAAAEVTSARPTAASSGQEVSGRKATRRAAASGGCNNVNYGDAGSGAHDYDQWNADPDRSHAASGSLADQWFQKNDKLPADLKMDNCIYTVQFGDSLSTIAKRELTTEGKAVNKQSLKDEMDLIVSLNDCHYQSLDNKQDRLQEGWKLVLRSDCTAQPHPPKAPEPVKEQAPPPPARVEPPPPPAPLPPQQQLEPPPPPPPPMQQPQMELPPPPPPPPLMPPPMSMLYPPTVLYPPRPPLGFFIQFGHPRHFPPPLYYGGGGGYGGYPPVYGGGASLSINIGGSGGHRGRR